MDLLPYPVLQRSLTSGNTLPPPWLQRPEITLSFKQTRSQQPRYNGERDSVPHPRAEGRRRRQTRSSQPPTPGSRRPPVSNCPSGAGTPCLHARGFLVSDKETDTDDVPRPSPEREGASCSAKPAQARSGAWGSGGRAASPAECRQSGRGRARRWKGWRGPPARSPQLPPRPHRPRLSSPTATRYRLHMVSASAAGRAAHPSRRRRYGPRPHWRRREAPPAVPAARLALRRPTGAAE